MANDEFLKIMSSFDIPDIKLQGVPQFCLHNNDLLVFNIRLGAVH